MKIGEMAKRSGMGIETIRYYEREGLLEEPRRRASGYREYDEGTVERLGYIRRAKELGFTLGEIRELMELSSGEHAGCDHVRRRAEEKLADIDEKIRRLRQMRRSLAGIVEQCRSEGGAGDCPLVHKSKGDSGA